MSKLNRMLKSIKILSVACCLFLSNDLKAQGNSFYLKAFDHLARLYAKDTLVVSPSIVNHNIDFIGQISKLWGKSEAYTLHVLDSLDHLRLKSKKLNLFKNTIKKDYENRH